MTDFTTFATYLARHGLTWEQSVATERAFTAWRKQNWLEIEGGDAYEAALVNYVSLRNQMEKLGVTSCEMFDHHDNYENAP